MKKLVLLLATAALVFSLAACGKKAEETAPAPEPAAAPAAPEAPAQSPAMEGMSTAK